MRAHIQRPCLQRPVPTCLRRRNPGPPPSRQAPDRPWQSFVAIPLGLEVTGSDGRRWPRRLGRVTTGVGAPVVKGMRLAARVCAFVCSNLGLFIRPIRAATVGSNTRPNTTHWPFGKPGASRAPYPVSIDDRLLGIGRRPNRCHHNAQMAAPVLYRFWRLVGSKSRDDPRNALSWLLLLVSTKFFPVPDRRGPLIRGRQERLDPSVRSSGLGRLSRRAPRSFQNGHHLISHEHVGQLLQVLILERALDIPVVLTATTYG